jgi:hypothetical protein
VTASLLYDGRSRAAGVLGATAHWVLSSESVVRFRSYVVVHRIYEEMALGTRPTVPYPRRSQIAPIRWIVVGPFSLRRQTGSVKSGRPAWLTKPSIGFHFPNARMT